MDVANIFNKLAETSLLKNLIKQGNLAFLGEKETVKYLQTFFEEQKEPSSYDYYFWQSDIDKIFHKKELLLLYDFIIVASVKDEHIIFNKIQKYLFDLSIKIPVLRLFSDIFINLQLKQKLLQSSDFPVKYPQIAYAIVSTPRSGSTALCEALAATQIAGFPTEHLRTPALFLTKYCKFDPLRYLQLLMTYQTTKNGVFGTKLISHFLEGYQASLSFDNFKFIYLIRRDKIAQAVSAFIATKTNMWHIYSEEQSKKYQSKLKTINIQDSDLERVHNTYHNCLRQELFLDHFFERYNISPLIIEYEEFAALPGVTLTKIMNYLNILEPNQRVNVLNKYQYKIYQIMNNLNIINNKNINVKLKTRKIASSDISKEIINRYRQEYSPKL